MSIGPEYKKMYGLIIPKSNEAAPVKKRPLSAVFNVDSDEEDTTNVHLQKNSFKNMKRQARVDIQKALEDDPSVYQYDEIYDEMKEDKQKKATLAKQDKTSKYAKCLLRNAAVRKLENDRNFERICQRELEDEGDEFADKESFITSSYKNKLAELAILEEEHKRMAEEEKKNDVTKKSDLTDFYRNILSQRTDEVASTAAQVEAAAPDTTDSKEEAEPPTASTAASDESVKPIIKKIRSEKRRTYRGRVSSDQARQDESDSEGGSESGDGDPKAPDTSTEKPGVSTAEDVPPKVKEDNPDRDDSNSSENDDDDTKETKPDEIVDEGADEDSKREAKKPPRRLIMSVEEQREERIKQVKESCKKRNTPETIQAAIERYWQRQAGSTASTAAASTAASTAAASTAAVP